MPISAEQWRASTGSLNAGKGSLRSKSRINKPPSPFGDLPSSPPSCWKGYYTMMVLLCVPLFYKVYLLCMAAMIYLVSNHSLPGSLLSTATTIGLTADVSSSSILVSEGGGVLFLLLNGILYVAMVMMVLLFGVQEHRGRDKHQWKLTQQIHHLDLFWLNSGPECEIIVDTNTGSLYATLSMDSLGALQHVHFTPTSSMKSKKTTFNIGNVFLGILSSQFILQLFTLVVAMLLLLAGDVERNPGPVTELTNNDHPDICKYIKVMDTKQLRHLGGELGLDFSNLEKMKDLPADMVAAWLRAEDNVLERSGSPSWESLVKALSEIGQKGIASRIKETEKLELQVDYTVLSQFGEKLKKRYAGNLESYIWPQSDIPATSIQSQDMAEKDLKTYPSSKPSKTLVKLHDVMSHIHPAINKKVILIEGMPGSGKTTHTKYYCHEWGHKRLFTEYKAIIRVQLGDKKVQEAKTIKELVNIVLNNYDHSSILAFTGPGIDAEDLFHEIIGREVLWILDGWDELPPRLRHRSVFCDLTKCSPCMSSVVITSRTSAQAWSLSSITDRYEILGFDEVQLSCYFYEVLTTATASERLHEFEITSLMTKFNIEYLKSTNGRVLPLHAAILVHLYKANETSTLNSLYELIDAFIRNILRNNLQRKNSESVVNIESLSIAYIPELLRTPFEQLCQLAFNGIMTKEQTFTFSKVSPCKLETLSLMKGFAYNDTGGEYVSYKFLHSTIQEYLAAWHFVNKVTSKDQLWELSKESDFLRENSSFLLFVLHLYYIPNETAQIGLKFIASVLGEKIDFSLHDLEPIDCKIVGCLLSSTNSSNGKVKVKLSQCFTNTQLCCKELFDQLQPDKLMKCEPIAMLSLDLRGNKLGTYASQSTSSNFLDDKSQVGVHEEKKNTMELLAKACPYIAELNLTRCSISDRECHIFENMITYPSSLDTLVLHSNYGIEDNGARYLAKGLQYSQCTLKLLDMSYCAITVKGAEDLSNALRTNRSLKNLHLDGCTAIHDDGIICIAESLKHNQTLKYLSLKACDLTDFSVYILMDMLKENHTLANLDVFGNPNLTKMSVYLFLSIELPKPYSGSADEKPVNVWLPDKWILKFAYTFEETQILIQGSKTGINPKCKLCFP